MAMVHVAHDRFLDEAAATRASISGKPDIDAGSLVLMPNSIAQTVPYPHIHIHNGHQTACQGRYALPNDSPLAYWTRVRSTRMLPIPAGGTDGFRLTRPRPANHPVVFFGSQAAATPPDKQEDCGRILVHLTARNRATVGTHPGSSISAPPRFCQP